MHAQTQSGFTLIELLVLVTIISILAMVAVPNFSATIKNDGDTAQINALLSGANLARSAALQHGGNVMLCAGASAGASAACSDSNWADGWTVVYAAPGATTQVIHTFAALANMSLNSTTGNHIVFNQNGMSFTDNTYTTPLSGTFILCDSRGYTYGRSLDMSITGSTQVAIQAGQFTDGTALTSCTP